MRRITLLGCLSALAALAGCTFGPPPPVREGVEGRLDCRQRCERRFDICEQEGAGASVGTLDGPAGPVGRGAQCRASLERCLATCTAP